VPHAPNTPETTRKTVTTNHKPRLDQFRRFRDDPDGEELLDQLRAGTVEVLMDLVRHVRADALHAPQVLL